MLRSLLSLAALGVLLSGCYMVPLALIGPASSGFSTASFIQSGITTSASYLVEKTTGKSISEHAFDVIGNDILLQTYLPKRKETTSIETKLEAIQIHKN